MANRQFLICLAIAGACFAALIALGYAWFGVLGFNGVAGQVAFGLMGAALVVGGIGIYVRLMPKPRIPLNARHISNTPPLPSWQERCTPIAAEEGLITCQHLFPIESALRSAGIRLYHPPDGGSRHVALADCWFHEESLREQLGIPSVVKYSPHGDHEGDNDQSFDCSVCHSGIRVFDNFAKRPRFPAPIVADPSAIL